MSKKIVLIIGASGVGKDSLIREAKKSLGCELNFVQRYITREPDVNEDNIYLDNFSFSELKNTGFFLSTWTAHSNQYGIAKDSIETGLNIISISRSTIYDFEKEYDRVYTINITIPDDELRLRLEARGRETKEEIDARMNRTYETIKANRLINFENTESLATSSLYFISLLKKIRDE